MSECPKCAIRDSKITAALAKALEQIKSTKHVENAQALAAVAELLETLR